MVKICSTIIVAYLAGLSMPLKADEHHYKNLLIGDRAAGLGESYVALSDDPSGIYHNPAGIVFGLEDYISLSANAFSVQKFRFKDLFPGQDYLQNSSELVPVFFGFTQSFKNHKIGFAVIVPDSESIDQNDTATRQADGTNEARAFRRKFFKRDVTYLFGPAFATEVSKNFSIGISLFGGYRSFKVIDNTTILLDPIGTGKYVLYSANANMGSYTLTPKIGFQYMPLPKLSLGLTLSKPFNLGGSGRIQITRTKTNNGDPVDPDGTFNNDNEFEETTSVFHDSPTPIAASVGAAYFFSKEWLVTSQVDIHGPQASFRTFPIRTTINFSLGTEYYWYEWLALRFGIFTNNAKTKSPDPSKTNQPPFVNLYGGALGIAVFRSGTSLSLNVTHSRGTGKGQAVADTAVLQTIKQSNLVVFLSGSYQL